MTRVREFGRIGGEVVHEVELRSPGGAVASIVTLGATLRDLVVPLADGTPRRVVLGYETLEALARDPAYLGVIAGRTANRIGGGGFVIDGRRHDIATNEGTSTSLHGGPQGFSRRIWRIEAVGEAEVELSLVSPDGDQGYPGRVEARCRYTLSEAGTLTVALSATSDAATPINLTNHAYFTLNDGGDCHETVLRLAARFYTPVDAAMIPTGEVAPVGGTAFDYREARPIGCDHDVNFVVDGAPGVSVVAAVASAPDGRLRLEVETDQPGLQLYTAQHLGSVGPSNGGLRIAPRSGFCLEAQGFPDAPNRRHFPSVLLRPGEVYRHRTIFRFVAA